MSYRYFDDFSYCFSGRTGLYYYAKRNLPEVSRQGKGAYILKNNTLDMCHGPLLKKTVLYTVPIILTGILQLLFNAADLVVVGQSCGNVSVAAVGATGALINLIVNLFIGLSVGAGVSVAQDLGARNEKDVSRIVHTAIPLSMVSGAFLTVVGVACARWFLELMHTPENVLPLSTLYMRIYFCGMIPCMVYNFGSAILRAAGDTKGPLIYLTVSGVINVLLNLLFVNVFHMDVAGVALATTISQTISAILIVFSLTRREDCCHLDMGRLGFDRRAMARMTRIGLPAGIQGSLFSISNVLIQSSINSFGNLVMSGNAAGSNIEGFIYTSMNALYQTTLNFVGQNVGAHKFDRVRRILGINLILVAIVGIAAGSTAWVFARPLLSIYITDSAEAIEYGVTRMTYICFPYFLCGLMDVMTGALRGLGSSVAPLIITVLGVCAFRVGWIYTVFRIPEYHTISSLYLSYPISWVLTLAAQLTAFFFIFQKIKRNALETAARNETLP